MSEKIVLRSAELGGSSSEGLGQLDGTILSIDGDIELPISA